MTKTEIAQAFSNGHFEKCFPYFTEQTIWNTPGEQLLTGKSEIEQFCEKIAAYFSSVDTRFQQIHLIENEYCIAINGTAEFIRDGQRVSFISSCDVYEFDEHNNIISITSYCTTQRPDKSLAIKF